MTAEEIVRRLADESPNCMHHEDRHVCGLCDAFVPVNAEDHEDDCPWRWAVEWVAAQNHAPSTK